MPQSLSKSISISLKKLGRKPKAVRNIRRLRTINERKLRPKVDEWMKLMIKDIQRGLSKLKSKNSKLADWKEIEETGNLILKPAILEILGEGGKAVVNRKILKQDRFDEIGTSAVKWAEKHTADLVTEVTTATQGAIKAFIVDGVKKGRSIPAIARQIRPLVGLTTKQIMAVANYEEWLIINRAEYSVKVIREMAEVKARRLHRYRAKLIAQTETRRALNEGTFQGFSQMGITKMEGVSSADSCDWCLANINGQVVSIDEARSIDGEVHPGCECAWVAAFKRPPKAYEVTAPGAHQAKIITVNDALKDLPYRHTARVEKYSIDTTAQFNKRAPYFKNRPNVAACWDYSEKTVHIKTQWVNKQIIFHETGHAVYEVGGIVPAGEKSLWEAWHHKAVYGQIKYPTEYALTNAEEFFAECYSHYYLKNYDLLEPEIKKWFIKTFR